MRACFEAHSTISTTITVLHTLNKFGPDVNNAKERLNCGSKTIIELIIDFQNCCPLSKILQPYSGLAFMCHAASINRHAKYVFLIQMSKSSHDSLTLSTKHNMTTSQRKIDKVVVSSLFLLLKISPVLNLGKYANEDHHKGYE